MSEESLKEQVKIAFAAWQEEYNRLGVPTHDSTYLFGYVRGLDNSKLTTNQDDPFFTQGWADGQGDRRAFENPNPCSLIWDTALDYSKIRFTGDEISEGTYAHRG